MYFNHLLLHISVAINTPLQIAERVRPMINSHDKPIPSILEMPAKDMPYDENKDSVMRRVKQILGRD